MPAISRRAFIRLSAGAVAALGAAPFGLPDVDGTVPTRTKRAFNSKMSLKELGAALHGRLVLPSTAGYATSRLVYDLRFESEKPIAIAYCASAVDVARCIAFARENNIAAIPRAGGHSYGGYSTGSGLVIDVSAMKQTSFDHSNATAVVGAGISLVGLYAACSDAGALVPGGSCPTVGIAGLALGGGVGVLGRKYGLTCDNIRQIEIVTPDGQLLACNEKSHSDLYWACQGGGGRNFGIVTSFSFATHPIPELSMFTLDWSWQDAPEVLSAWQRWMAGAPDELWSNCQLLSAGSAGLSIRSSGVLVGPSQTLQRLLHPLLAATKQPTGQFVGSDSYLQTMLVEAGCDGLPLEACQLASPGGSGTLQRALFEAKSAYGSKVMPSAGIEKTVDAVASGSHLVPDAGAALIFDAYGGAINAVKADQTAFVHRDSLFGIQMTLEFSPYATESTLEARAKWLESTANALAPYCNGEAYQNYIDPTLSNWQKAYYGTNLARLSQVKHRYDPDDVFKFAQSIPLPK